MRTFAVIALVSSCVVFFVFSLRLVWQEEAQIESHLKSFKGVAEQFYKRLSPEGSLKLSDNVTAYYGEGDFTDQLKKLPPMALDTVDRQRFEIRLSKNDILIPGVVVYHFSFEDQGNNIPTYIAISSFDMDLWDDSWGVLMATSTLLMLGLIIVLRITLKRVFDQLMAPIENLSTQLSKHESDNFHVPTNTVDELQLLTSHLNSYSKMKDRLAKQEMMFAKYASHELKTPIAIVTGAAELQAMKPNDLAFQTKQRNRILGAANGMSATVEILLNIVKQENSSTEKTLTAIDEAAIDLSKYRTMLAPGVELLLNIEPDTTLNMPLPIVNMVLKNYIENAIRFTTQGKITVIIHSNTISVSDTGAGLSDDTKTEHGLGLIIVNRIGDSYGWTSTLTDNAHSDSIPDTCGCTAIFSRSDT
ncbi:sensor histidine kinase [Vibrio splendidus]|uniref:ATP-binding protein n=1 Tax=Vibrio splendidus TaxID=29497 RepID=UPI000C86430E|nr:HAMP domain-containing sensor histidine kinase [Vibrio splendidus]MDH5903399.1 HAMP domain-containing histidine kinase [Vibrio splendidus]PMO24270.1 two-component sensor histidine kinase [Vibrio splendidus]PMO47347.1 two-component sensor histidine kinase [Vibrio splendidus]PTP46723.1 sensor histidine kinase [Vibrio splendidus]PTQ18051.1 sensor histidine kinase [Vibrio splendidus]